MKTCRLVDGEDPEAIHKSGYTRCGRTDKGVSALGNVCALKMRKLKDESYCLVLNRVLPEDIKMLAFEYVPEDFNARFSC